MEKLDVLGNPAILEEKDKGGNIMEKRDVFGNPVILDAEQREEQKEILFNELYEMFSLGWRDNKAREDQEAFFERIGEEYAGGLTEEDIWAVWRSVLEYVEESMRDSEDSEEKIAAIMAGDDEAAAEIEARERCRKWVSKRKNSPFPLKDGEKIIIRILYPTGNRFEGGELEIGSEEEYEVGSADEFYDIIDEIPALTEYIVQDANGKDLVDILPQYCDE